MRISLRGAIFFTTILLGFFLYIYLLNPLELEFRISPNTSYKTSLSVLMLLSFLGGAIFVGLTDLIKDIKRGLEFRGIKRAQKVLWENLKEALEKTRKGDLEGAERLLKEALSHEPDNSILLLQLARVYRSQRKWEEALRVLKSLKESPLEGLFLRLEILLETGNTPEAERTLREILELDSDNREALRVLRDMKIKEGLWEEALRLHEKLLKVDPKENGNLLLALRYERAKALGEKDLSGALKELKRLSKQNPLFTPAWVTWGDLLLKKDKPKASFEVWKKGYRFTQNPIFLQRMEELYLKEGDPRGAIRMYLEFLGENPDSPILLYLYSKLCVRLGMAEEALKKLQELELVLGNYPHYHYLKAKALIAKEAHEEATRSMLKTIDLEEKINWPYRCETCDHEEPQWLDRCPSCSKWGTFTIKF